MESIDTQLLDEVKPIKGEVKSPRHGQVPPGTGSIPQEWVKSPRHRQVPLGTGRFPQEWAKSPRNGQKSKKNRKRELTDKKHKKIAREQERMRKIQKNTCAAISFLQFWGRQLADRVPFSTGIM